MSGRLFRLLVATMSVSTVVLINACSEDCSVSNTCAGSTPADDGGGSDGPDPLGDSGPDGVAPPDGCDPNADPKDAPKCVVSEFGIFVDATGGNDGNTGTKELPMKSIGAALSKINGRPRIYVCEGTYPESVKLTSPISIFGGFACGSWTYTGNKPIVSPSSGVAGLEVSGLAALVRVSDIAFRGAPATPINRSSIAVFVRHSKIDFIRIEAKALDAANGSDGVAASNYDPGLLPDDEKIAGGSASGTNGGGQQDCSNLCTNGIKSTGGKGGNGGNTPSAGDPGKPDRGAGFGGSPNASCLSVGAGGIGGLGNPGQGGTDALPASAVGKVTDQGWTPSDGAAGTVGGPGQGGGGGGGSTSASNGAGGGGGCGGCGGAPGGASSGGGGSIALLVLNSIVTVADSLLVTQKAGNGGAGIPGQTGQAGGAGGIQTALGCQGGAGGKGGQGGASAGGAGGISVGIVYRGEKPTRTNVTITTGAKGAKGTGGTSPANDGPDGMSQEEFEAAQ